MKKLIRIALGLIVAQLASSAWAGQGSFWETEPGSKLELQMSSFTYHYTYDEAHRNVLMVGVERERANGKLDGIAAFSNSFGQPCLYLFPWGNVWHGVAGVDALSVKWTAGLLYGYVEPYENKVPMNYNGFSPGAVLSVAYEFTPGWSAQINMLGTAALMFQLNVTLK